MNSYTISWDGRLLGCQILELFSVNVREKSFINAWEEFPYHVVLPSMNPQCSQCKISRHCESCYAARFAETGNLCGYSEYQCQDAHEIIKLCMEDSCYEKI